MFPSTAPRKGSANALLLMAGMLGLLPLAVWTLCFVSGLHTKLGHCRGMFPGLLGSAWRFMPRKKEYEKLIPRFNFYHRYCNVLFWLFHFVARNVASCWLLNMILLLLLFTFIKASINILYWIAAIYYSSDENHCFLFVSKLFFH